ncbi:MAG: response regulator [Alphaproteobacteria bacterium]|nr:response regulator [Alphaproteobacteria bacterium]MBV8547903.1 response regulator [Alphaproteobacteria bacterium]
MTLSNIPLHPSTARVLVAEDNPAVREFISRALAGAGYQVAAVPDGHQALEMLSKEHFHVLVTDIVMPQIDGIALATKAVRLYPDLRIVMISGYAQERMRAHNLDSLVHSILAKPFSLEEICDAVKHTISHLEGKLA